MTKLTVLVSMVRATETGPQEFAPGDSIEVPSDHVQRLIDRRIAKRPDEEKARRN